MHEVDPYNFRGFLRQSRYSVAIWLGSIVVVSIFFNTYAGQLAGYYLDRSKYITKKYLDPEKYAERSALANVIPEMDMSEELQDKLAVLFIKLDRVSGDFNEVFERAGVKGHFPDMIGLTQFLLICNCNRLGDEEIKRLYMAAKGDLEYEEEIEEKMKKNILGIYERYDEKISIDLKAEETLRKKLEKEVLEREIRHYKEKNMKSQPKRFKRIMGEIGDHIKSLKD